MQARSRAFGAAKGGFSLAIVAWAVAGCVTVTPAQRQQLSKPEMNPATDANEDQFQAHIDNARKGSMGGRGGAAGGGCGCG
jgi:hypothetical protein